MLNMVTIDRDFNGAHIRQRKSDGFLDATAMCKATGKRWFDYHRLEATQAFINALSSETGYPASQLIESQKGNTAKFEQGTWVHPQVAINLAQWCSPQFAVLVSKWVFELLTTGKTELQTSPASSMIKFAQFNRDLMVIFGIERNMQTIALNNAMQKQFGVNLLEAWGVNDLKAETQEQTLTVSDIADQLGIGRRDVNPILIEIDLQTKHRDHKNNVYYELTDAGLQYAIYVDTGKRHKTDSAPVKQIKWYASVVDVIKAHLEATFTLTGGAA